MKEPERANKDSTRRRLAVLRIIERAFKEGKPKRTSIPEQLSDLASYAKTKTLDSNTEKDEYKVVKDTSR